MKKSGLFLGAFLLTLSGIAEVIPPQQEAMIERSEFEKHYAKYREHFSINAPKRIDPAMKVESETTHQGFRMQTVSYLVEADERINAYLIYPKDMKPGEKRPLVLCLHGTNIYGKDAPVGNFASYPPAKNEREVNKRINRLQALHLAERGFICFVPDRPGYGARRVAEFKEAKDAIKAQSAYIAKLKETRPGWDYRRGKVIHDLQQALDFLEKMPEIDAANIGSIGHSLGGTDTAEIAAADKRIKAAVISCGGGITIDKKYWEKSEKYADLVKKSLPMPVERNLTLHAIAPRAMFLLVGMTDQFSPQSMMRSVQLLRDYYLSQMPAKDLEQKHLLSVMFHSAGHDMPEYVRDTMYAWLKQQLMPPKQ